MDDLSQQKGSQGEAAATTETNPITTTSKPESVQDSSHEPHDASPPSQSAIQPHQDDGKPTEETTAHEPGPSLTITLLRPNGNRHAFPLNERYLKRREINVPENDPYNMTIWTLKEAIWREWRDDWEARPATPTLIRLIQFGKFLEDKTVLRETDWTPEGPNVVHLILKPQEVVEEEDTAKAKGGFLHVDRNEGERTPSCRCVIF
ncbi:MAG: hypothetical protein M1834_006958 [Cirrosporium novae-zelandiae]|nr:MAG: hypothetical protein M1834_006958 [Cirrosporium novae-zelandiae]